MTKWKIGFTILGPRPDKVQLAHVGRHQLHANQHFVVTWHRNVGQVRQFELIEGLANSAFGQLLS